MKSVRTLIGNEMIKAIQDKKIEAESLQKTQTKTEVTENEKFRISNKVFSGKPHQHSIRHGTWKR